MEMQEFTNNDPDHTGEADDNNTNESTSAAVDQTNTPVGEKSKEKKVRPDYTKYERISKI